MRLIESIKYNKISSWRAVPAFFIFWSAVIGLVFFAKWLGLDFLHIILILIVIALLVSGTQDS